ncbi:MAG: DUF3276 family protein [Bacteroidota bacterium]|nr:DUF3276 family protein [Bacteroidota bacterium]
MDSLFSRTVKSGKTTYFIDVKEAKNKSKYITIAESQPSATDDKKFTRKSIIVFDNSAEKLRSALDEAIQMINRQ